MNGRDIRICTIFAFAKMEFMEKLFSKEHEYAAMRNSEEKNIFLVFIIHIGLKGYVHSKRIGTLIGVTGFEIGFRVIARVRCNYEGI